MDEAVLDFHPFDWWLAELWNHRGFLVETGADVSAVYLYQGEPRWQWRLRVVLMARFKSIMAPAPCWTRYVILYSSGCLQFNSEFDPSLELRMRQSGSKNRTIHSSTSIAFVFYRPPFHWELLIAAMAYELRTAREYEDYFWFPSMSLNGKVFLSVPFLNLTSERSNFDAV